MKKRQTSSQKKTTLKSDGIFCRSADVLARKNPDNSISILRLDDEQRFFVLDGIAAVVWTLIDGKRSIDKIKLRIIEKYQPPADKFEKDLTKLIVSLKKQKLIEIS